MVHEEPSAGQTFTFSVKMARNRKNFHGLSHHSLRSFEPLSLGSRSPRSPSKSDSSSTDHQPIHHGLVFRWSQRRLRRCKCGSGAPAATPKRRPAATVSRNAEEARRLRSLDAFQKGLGRGENVGRGRFVRTSARSTEWVLRRGRSFLPTHFHTRGKTVGLQRWWKHRGHIKGIGMID